VAWNLALVKIAIFGWDGFIIVERNIGDEINKGRQEGGERKM
jgi:hypothetical protein